MTKYQTRSSINIISLWRIYASVNKQSLAPMKSCHLAKIWTNAWILLIGTLGTNFSEILIEIYTFHSRKCIWICRLHKWRTFCLGPNVLNFILSAAAKSNKALRVYMFNRVWCGWNSWCIVSLFHLYWEAILLLYLEMLGIYQLWFSSHLHQRSARVFSRMNATFCNTNPWLII